MASLLGLNKPKLVHIVLFKFQADAEPHVIQKYCKDFVQLAEDCRKKDGAKYIHSIEAGKDCSIEGKSRGLTHAFVVKFRSKEDRDYYVNEDAVHAGFVKSLLKLEDAQVIDFVDGEW